MNHFADRLLHCTLLLGLMTLVATASIQAQMAQDFRLLPDPQQGFSVHRVYFVFEAAAGKVIDDGVLVRNESRKPLRLSLFPADAVTASHGGIAVATPPVNTPEHAGAWLHLSQTELALEPGEDRSVPFTVSLPGNLVPGEYAASIVAQRTEDENPARSGPFGVRFIPRFAVTVLVTVPGSVELQPQLEITDLQGKTSPRQQTVIANLENTGNDGLKKPKAASLFDRRTACCCRTSPSAWATFLLATTWITASVWSRNWPLANTTSPCRSPTNWGPPS